jgi:hypothetical protein
MGNPKKVIASLRVLLEQVATNDEHDLLVKRVLVRLEWYRMVAEPVLPFVQASDVPAPLLPSFTLLLRELLAADP